jgi:hypothetical protein
MRKNTTFTTSLLTALFVIGYSGNAANALAASTAGVEGYDCADLISEQEIDQIIELSGTERVTNTRGDENDILLGHTQCGYALPQDFVLGISVYSGEGFGEALETFDVVWGLAQSQGAEALPGLGDSALIQTDFPAGPRVLVRARGRGILVGAGDLEGLGKLDLDEVIMRVLAIVIERL